MIIDPKRNRECRGEFRDQKEFCGREIGKFLRSKQTSGTPVSIETRYSDAALLINTVLNMLITTSS